MNAINTLVLVLAVWRVSVRS